MRRPKTLIASLALTLSPCAAFAHPGHADGFPLLHEMSHAIHYLVVFLAVGIWTAQALGRVRQSRAARKRTKE
jgi:hydrogenase/urease accessory protein HupE